MSFWVHLSLALGSLLTYMLWSVLCCIYLRAACTDLQNSHCVQLSLLHHASGWLLLLLWFPLSLSPFSSSRGVCWAPQGFSLLEPWPGNLLKAVRWAVVGFTLFFLSLRGHWLLLSYVISVFKIIVSYILFRVFFWWGVRCFRKEGNVISVIPSWLEKSVAFIMQY